MAVNVTQIPVESLPDIPVRYFIACTSDPADLNVQNIKLQEISVENVREVLVSSPVNNMEDFVCFSASNPNHGEPCNSGGHRSAPVLENSKTKSDECTV